MTPEELPLDPPYEPSDVPIPVSIPPTKDFVDPRQPDGTLKYNTTAAMRRARPGPPPKNRKHKNLNRVPIRNIERQYYDAFRRGCTLERFEKLVGKICDLAENGDMRAAKLIMDRAVPTDKLSEFIKMLQGESPNAPNLNIMVVTSADLEARKARLRAAIVE